MQGYWVVDRLPRRLWRLGNAYMGGRLHMCHDFNGVRTIEWQGKAIAHGQRFRLNSDHDDSSDDNDDDNRAF